ncbi:MAG: endopeptidase La [candidate division WOR-3 bacterium]|nr:endopeptidase La [candidate division WOR-3 bacterium]
MKSVNPKKLYVLIDYDQFMESDIIIPGKIGSFVVGEDDFPFKASGLKENDYIAIKYSSSNRPVSGLFCRIINIDIIGGNTAKIAFYPENYIEFTKIIDYNHYKKARVKQIEFTNYPEGKHAEALKEILREKALIMIKYLKRDVSSEVRLSVMNENNILALSDMILSFIPADRRDIKSVLSNTDIEERINLLLKIMEEKLSVYEEKERISQLVKSNVSDNQKKYFLNEQLKVIKKELGYSTGVIDENRDLKEKIYKANMSEEANDKAMYELKRLAAMNPSSPEATVIRNYLDWLINVPWYEKTEDNLNIALADEILDKNHYGLKKIKERVLEYLAVLKLSDNVRGQILCFVGPPGVGKTSLGRSIAQSMNRGFVRISLGGVRDEAEIRGHRKTYIGSMPGKIIQMMRRSEVVNPVFMLDEVDKLGSDFRGDPSSALLEVLDPQLNNAFMDHYLEVEYDLSNVLFICTANIIHTIPPALRDRMEIINLPGYLEYEKYNIAKRFLIPKSLSQSGLKSADVKIHNASLKAIVKNYTMEAGVRNLEKQINKIHRKVAKKKAMGVGKGKFSISKKQLSKYLGPPPRKENQLRNKKMPGIVNGLAWTSFGGNVMTVEVLVLPGTGKMHLTGQLGDVLKESARAAVSYLRKYADKYSIEEDFYRTKDIHIHIPEGAIPKEGPSAGITIVTALYSALKGKSVKRNFAMTGEITLKGIVLPIGGLAEKIVAAQSAGMENVIIPFDNKPDFNELSKEAKKNINVHFIKNVDDAFKLLFK